MFAPYECSRALERVQIDVPDRGLRDIRTRRETGTGICRSENGPAADEDEDIIGVGKVLGCKCRCMFEFVFSDGGSVLLGVRGN